MEYDLNFARIKLTTVQLFTIPTLIRYVIRTMKTEKSTSKSIHCDVGFFFVFAMKRKYFKRKDNKIFFVHTTIRDKESSKGRT